ncbi:tyrosine-type recombinase/integrase [Pontibacter brevis]
MFVSVYLEGKRLRFYNGAMLGINCNPNRCKSLPARERELRRLARELYAALKRGWTPDQEEAKPDKPVELGVLQLLGEVAATIPSSFSNTYRRDIKKVCEEFSAFLQEQGLMTLTAKQVESSHIETFLQRFSSSGTYYMNKRRTLSAAFLRLQNTGFLERNPVAKTSRRKSKAVLHKAYTGGQLTEVLSFLQEHYPNLYLCALLMYGTMMRPHQEIRLLKRQHFNEDFTRYTLDGYENKSGRLRSLPVPEYVREELLRRGIGALEGERNIFTGYRQPYNECYFNTMWSRARKKMLELALIQQNQTLYSFRHAASVNVFERTQNLKLLQQLLGHSSLNTSLTYLRSIGTVQVESNVMPEL